MQRKAGGARTSSPCSFSILLILTWHNCEVPRPGLAWAWVSAEAGWGKNAGGAPSSLRRVLRGAAKGKRQTKQLNKTPN